MLKTTCGLVFWLSVALLLLGKLTLGLAGLLLWLVLWLWSWFS